VTISRRRLLGATAAAIVAASCGPAASRPNDVFVPLYADPLRDQWPDEFRQLPDETQAMYRYAVANRDALRYMPCFCGCVAVGHASNFDCYVREVLPDGRVRLDTMSFG